MTTYQIQEQPRLQENLPTKKKNKNKNHLGFIYINSIKHKSSIEMREETQKWQRNEGSQILRNDGYTKKHTYRSEYNTLLQHIHADLKNLFLIVCM